MITYKGTLNVSAHEFYETLLLQICADINQKTKRELTLKDIQKGCRYRVKKKVGNKIQDSVIEVAKPEPDHKVVTTNTIDGVVYKMVYEIEGIDDNHTNVNYYQDNGGKNEGFLARKLVERNMKSRLKEFEKYIIKNRSK